MNLLILGDVMGASGRKAISNKLPDLILLDRNMPQISGDECIRILKADSLWKNIPVLFLTAQVALLSDQCISLLEKDFLQ